MDKRAIHRPPGLLRADAKPDIAMMICTAGHVDHGKTQLVRLLTGCNTDRLKEEQERGLTIELGFAPCVIGEGLNVGIVDVPGHEKFIRTMVAGVSGIEMTILVIAANDGVMPQTVEHLRIMEFMGVPRGIVALTKTDLADNRRIDEVTGDIRCLVHDTFMESAQICPVSSTTYDGFPEFYAALVTEIGGMSKRRRSGLFRMPVENVFKSKGFGSVVTGIPVDGSVTSGTELEMVPGGQRGKVRSIQQFLRTTDYGEYGQCLALNIPEFGKTPPVRGQVLSLPGLLEPMYSFHVDMNAIKDIDVPVKNAETVRFHTGTSDEQGKVYLLESSTLAGGENGFAIIVLANPVVAAPYDRFIIRRLSPQRTIGGGMILDASSSQEKPKKRAILERLTAFRQFFDGVDVFSEDGRDKRILFYLQSNPRREITIDELSKKMLLPIPSIEASTARLRESGFVMYINDETVMHMKAFDSLCNDIEMWLSNASAHEGTLTVPISAARTEFDCSARLFQTMIDRLEKKGILIREDNTLVLLSAAETLNELDRLTLAKLISLYERDAFQSPRPDELPSLIDVSEKKIRMLLEYLITRKQLVRLSSNVILSRNAFIKAQNIVIAVINERGHVDSGDFKEYIGSSRKYALAILDYLDGRHVTIRNGNFRVLAPDYTRNLLT